MPAASWSQPPKAARELIDSHRSRSAVVASAIIDRLLHNATVINIEEHSYLVRRYDAAQRTKGSDALVALP